MKETGIIATLISFVVLGVCSAIIVPAYWNALTQDDGFAILGALLFLIGAGLGAALILIAILALSRRRVQNDESVKEVAVEEEKDREVVQKLPKVVDIEIIEKDKIELSEKETHDIEVRYAHETRSSHGIKPTETHLMNKLGLRLDFKSVLHKLTLKMGKWTTRSGGDVFSPSQKAWEKNGQMTETVGVPTPRIYVLPPDGPEGVTAVQLRSSSHSRSRSELPSSGKVGLPDVTILDIKYHSKGSERDEGDDASGSSSTCPGREASSELNVDIEHNTSEEEPSSETGSASLALPVLRSIDTQLGSFVQSLEHRDTKLAYMLSVMIEEVLPRPDSGLLKRMLRMSEIPVGMVEGSGEPILHLRIGSECHISIGLIKLNDQPSHCCFEISGPHLVRLKPLDGDEVALNVKCEAVDKIEHVTSAIWDLKSHTSHSLSQAATGDSASTVLTPIEMTLVFHIHYPDEGDLIREIEVKKTFMASMRRDLVSLDVDQRFMYEDAVLDFVLSKLELISMPSLLMFLELEHPSKCVDIQV